MRLYREQIDEPVMHSSSVANSRIEIERRGDAGRWRGSWLVLFLLARSVFSLLAQALAAGVFALRSVPDPWVAAAPWFPVYGTLVDVGCLTALWWLTRREGIALFDLVSVDRSRWRREPPRSASVTRCPRPPSTRIPWR